MQQRLAAMQAEHSKCIARIAEAREEAEQIRTDGKAMVSGMQVSCLPWRAPYSSFSLGILAWHTLIFPFPCERLLTVRNK